jgi:hypothetical protein
MEGAETFALIAVLIGIAVIGWVGGYYWAVDSRPEDRMGEIHDKKVSAALDAINEVFSDTSVSQGDTKISLNSLVDEIAIMTETLEES